MTTVHPPANDSNRAILIVFGGFLLYLIANFISYSSYPLALSPQLDAAENLRMAAEFDADTTQSEPFYRAPFYPWFLSLLHPSDWRTLLGMTIGFLCHLLNGALVFRISWEIWRCRWAATLAAALCLLNPASIFFSLQLLDITMGISFFLGGLCLAMATRQGIRGALGTGAAFGLAVVTRPHFLPVVLLAPVAFLLLPGKDRAGKLWAYIPIAAVLLAQGFINFQRSGDFQILPWQGAYNLWAANKPGSNGLYYTQEIDLSALADMDNPAKEESILLYSHAHPKETRPYPIKKMNSFWRSKAVNHALENPLQVAGLWMFKAYAVLNNSDQYNNMTFSFHRARLPLLRFNPLNWGILLVLAALGGFVLAVRNRPALRIMIILIIGYSVALILYYASARFRLPLIPLMAVMGGGVIPFVSDFRKAYPRLNRNQYAAIFTAGLLAMLAFSWFAGIRSTDTYIQDRLLLASANASIQRDLQAALLAREVLSEQPGRNEAQQLYAVSYFNTRLSGNEAFNQLGNWTDQKSWVEPEAISDPDLKPLVAFYLWHWGQQAEALAVWEGFRQTSPLASAALQAMSLPPDQLNAEATAVSQLLNSH